MHDPVIYIAMYTDYIAILGTVAVDYGGFYGECEYGGCVSVRVWPMG